jgi:adenine-specific DNA-methyltransferase
LHILLTPIGAASKYPNQTYQLDTYLIFLERALRDLLKPNGMLGVIIPNPWLTNLLQGQIRRFVTEGSRILEIVHFKFPVFPKVTVDTQIVVLQKSDPTGAQTAVTVVETSSELSSPADGTRIRQTQHEQDKWRALTGGVINIFLSPAEEALAAKCLQRGQPLSSLCTINVGIKPYQKGKGTPAQTAETVKTRPFDSTTRLDDSYRQYLRGSDIRRYAISPQQLRFLKYGPWLAEPRPAANFEAPAKILVRQTGDSLIAALDERQMLCLNNLHVVVPNNRFPSPHFLLGIINSKLLNWYYHSLNPEVGEALAEVKKANVARLPIITINPMNVNELALHDRLAALVKQMMELNVRRTNSRTTYEAEASQRHINATDQQIDRLVYELYGLTDEDISSVESGSVAAPA